MYSDIERVKSALEINSLTDSDREDILAMLKELEKFRIEKRMSEFRGLGNGDLDKTI